MTGTRLGNRQIGTDHEPLLIAELSGNHNGSMERALAIVDAAADAGAHALKLQTYTADRLTLDLSEGPFLVPEGSPLWSGRSLHDLYREAFTPWEWHPAIFARCRERGLICFSTPCDEDAVAFLEGLECPAYKIASFECTHLPLIQAAARTGKPLFLSVGMATLGEIAEAVEAARGAGCPDPILLKCTSSYPSDPTDSHLRTIPHLRECFGTEVGLSDHTQGIGVAIAAVALGASVIEKHLTLDRGHGGPDAAFSLEPEEFRRLAEETRRSWRALGRVRYGPTPSERGSLAHRRSLYVVEDLPPGAVLTADNVRAVRPGAGLAPKYYPLLLGKKVNRPVRRGEPLAWEMIG